MVPEHGGRRKKGSQRLPLKPLKEKGRCPRTSGGEEKVVEVTLVKEREEIIPLRGNYLEEKMFRKLLRYSEVALKKQKMKKISKDSLKNSDRESEK